MKEIPILFSTPMVQAILDLLKAMTRRMKKLELVNQDPDNWICVATYHILTNDTFEACFENIKTKERIFIKCPYGLYGDVLWVRETWCLPSLYDGFEKDYYFKAGFNPTVIDNRNASQSWRPSIHMPKEAARIWLQVEEIRVERLNGISTADVFAEGMQYKPEDLTGTKDGWSQFAAIEKRFQKLWNKINGPESWDANPWVWVIKFKVLSTTGKPEIKKAINTEGVSQ